MSAGTQELGTRLSPKALVTDPDIVAGYSRDSADIVPAGKARALVRANCLDDVKTTLTWANEEGVPVVPRGAGTGLSGGANAIDGCIVLSLDRMTAIRTIDPQERYAIVEAGVINADLGRAAAAQGLFYPPDPSSFETCTIGGEPSNNARRERCPQNTVTPRSVFGLAGGLAHPSRR